MPRAPEFICAEDFLYVKLYIFCGLAKLEFDCPLYNTRLAQLSINLHSLIATRSGETIQIGHANMHPLTALPNLILIVIHARQPSMFTNGEFEDLVSHLPPLQKLCLDRPLMPSEKCVCLHRSGPNQVEGTRANSSQTEGTCQTVGRLMDDRNDARTRRGGERSFGVLRCVPVSKPTCINSIGIHRNIF